MLGLIAKTRRQLRAIAARESDLDTVALRRALLRIRLRQILKRSPTKVRVMGVRLHLIDFDTFAALFDEIFINEQYRPPPASAEPFIIDGGANIGVAVAYFKTVRPTARVLAFEPDPQACEVLRTNVAANGWTDVEVVQAALAEHDGELRLFRDRPGSVLATTQAPIFSDSVPVEARKLSPHIGSGADLIKLDIEGAEAAVIRELAAENLLRRVRCIVFEHGLHHPDAGRHGLGPVLSLLEEHRFGYAISAPYLPPLDETAPQNVLVRARRLTG